MKTLRAVLCIALLCCAAFAYAGTLQGFETAGPYNWSAGTVVQTASGGGTLGLTAASGSHYGELHNGLDGYAPGYGDAGYTFFGVPQTTYTGNFFKSVDVYVDPTWTGGGFWLDGSPNTYGGTNWGGEHNFHFNPTGTSVGISVDNFGNITTINAAGWYTFEMLYRQAGNPNDPALTDMNVYDSSHNLLGSSTLDATSPGGPLASKDLTGPGYFWVTVWQNGSANDVIGIDNIRTGAVPEPGSLGLLATGMAGIALGLRRKLSR